MMSKISLQSAAMRGFAECTSCLWSSAMSFAASPSSLRVILSVVSAWLFGGNCENPTVVGECWDAKAKDLERDKHVSVLGGDLNVSL